MKNEKDTQINFAQNYSEHWKLIQISDEVYSSYLNDTGLSIIFNLFQDLQISFFSKENKEIFFF